MNFFNTFFGKIVLCIEIPVWNFILKTNNNKTNHFFPRIESNVQKALCCSLFHYVMFQYSNSYLKEIRET